MKNGRISTQHRRPVRWADSHTAPAPGKMGGFPHSTGAGKVGGFPHSTGARQGGRIPHGTGAGKVGGFHTAPAPG
ncbi:hypothetical protein KU54_01365 (plasmid) [Klebsiella pneumoniae]|nr:hypothetical protein KU54_01365 [Klebsiella pneumoniae]